MFAITAAACAIVGGSSFWPVEARAQTSVCSILSPAVVSSVVHEKIDTGFDLTRSDPKQPGESVRACSYSGKTHSVVLALYQGSESQLARVMAINQAAGSAVAIKGGILVSAHVSVNAGRTRKPDRAAAKTLLSTALAKM